MKQKLILFCMLCLSGVVLSIPDSLLLSNTITVNQDGSADYTQINIAVAESVDGDTIKVYPGTYEGNILLEDRHNLLITSLYHWTEIDSFMYNTIIDGELEYTGIKFDLCSNITLQGFTIQNCVGTNPHYCGAGIRIMRSDPIYIFDNYITENHASWGGGVNISGNFPENQNYVDLRNNVITKNYAANGAGLNVTNYSTLLMNEENCNLIYNNFANFSADIHLDVVSSQNIFVEKISINPSDDNFSPYYYYDYNSNCNLSANNYMYDLYDNDVYVDGINGNNNNPGSSEEPFKTITHALSRIRSNTDNTNKVYINSGIYNQEGCSLPIKNNIGIIGNDNTIIDYNNRFFFNILISGGTVSQIQNLTIENILFCNINTSHITSIMMFCNPENIILNNIKFENIQLNHSLLYFWQDFLNSAKIDLFNVHIDNYTNGLALGSFGADTDIINCSIKNSEYTYWGEGEAKAVIAFAGYVYNPNHPTINVINTEVTNNEAANNWPGETGAPCGICTGPRTNVNIINSTITNNRGVPSYYHPSGEYGRAIRFWEQDSHVNVINSIIYGNDELDIGYKDPGFYDQNNNYSLNVVNSIVGAHEIDLLDNQISFDDVWNDDPGFAGEEAEYPFSLLENSYVIDAGTMNYLDYLPEGFEFPEFDLAGNPRISGYAIDLGAYEYQDSVFTQETEISNPTKVTKINSYPNPVRLSKRSGVTTKIRLNLVDEGNYKLDIYNIKGQKVRSILDAFLARGKHSFSWNGKDINNRSLSSGTYLIKCELDGELVTTSKMTIVK